MKLDIILCSGNGSLSRKIKWFNHVMGYDNDLTHVALKIEWLNSWVFESTTLNKYVGTKGVQMNHWTQWLENYDGKVWTRSIDISSLVLFPHEFLQKAYSMVGTPYESGIPGYIELILTFFDFGLKRIKTKELHCTEVITMILQEFGMIQRSVRPEKMPPAYWTEYGNVVKYFKVPLGDMEVVK